MRYVQSVRQAKVSRKFSWLRQHNRLDNGAIGDDGIFGDDDDAITREPAFVVGIFTVGEGADGDVVANAGVFVDDGAFDAAIGADADVWTG